MLLSALDAINNRGFILSMVLADISGGYSVKNIDGLGPVKATLVSTSFANMDGEQYHSSRREARDIKLSLGLEPDWAIEDVKAVRDRLYNFFMPKSAVTLKFELFDRFADLLDNKLNVQIDGRVETCDPDIFTEEPSVEVNIRCFDPDFVDLQQVVYSGNTVSDLTESTLTYDGTTDTGVLFNIRPDRALDAFTIYYRPPDQTLRVIDFTQPLAAGDVLAISSVPGSKYATLTRAGVESSILYGITPQSDWLTLQPGDNALRVYAAGAAIPFDITYTNRYGGL